MSDEFPVKLLELAHHLDGFGLKYLVRLKLNSEPRGDGTLPSLPPVSPCQVDDQKTHSDGEEVGQGKLEHHHPCYRPASVLTLGLCLKS